MNPDVKTLLGVLTTTAVLVPIALGAALGWPAWSWLFLAVPLLGALGLVARSIQRHGRWERRWQQAALPDQVEPQDEFSQRPVAGFLPSVVADYAFYFSAMAHWDPAEGATIEHADFGGLAAKAIIHRAWEITAAEQPNSVDLLQDCLKGELGAVRPDASGGVRVWADQVQLTLSDADRERLRRHSDLCKDDALWGRECESERRKRDYLSDVLKSTGSAVTWLLVQKKDDVEQTAGLIGKLGELCAVANHAEVPALIQNGSSHNGSLPTTWFPTAGLAATPFSDARPVVRTMGALMDTLDFVDDKRALFACSVAHLIEKFGKSDDAQEVQRHFNAPATDSEPADLSALNGGLGARPEPDVEPPLREEPESE